MGEIAAFVNSQSKPRPLSVIQFPSGNWGFAGAGPTELFYTGPADAIEIGKKMGMGFVRHRGVEMSSWPTKAEALAAAAALGAVVSNAA